MTVPLFLFSSNNSRRKELRAKTSVKDSINFLISHLQLSSSLKKKPDNLSLLTVNLKMFSIKLKKITKDWLKNSNQKRPQFQIQTEKLNNWEINNLISRIKSTRLRKNVKKAKESIKISVKLLIMLQTRTKIFLVSSRTLKIQWELVKVNLTNLPSKERLFVKNILNSQMRTKSWIVRLISAF